jgi:hypothetical protein
MALKSIITPKNVREELSKLAPIKTPVMDDIYPASTRDTYPFDTITIEEVAAIAKAVPVVARGSASVTLGGGTTSQSTIEPLPVLVNKVVTAADLNRIKSLTSAGQKIWLRNTIDYIRKTARKTAEALCAQSLSGKIEFAMKTENGLDTYTVDYGSPLSTDAKVNLTDGTLGDAYLYLSDLAEIIEENGGGSDIQFRVGRTAFAKLLSLVLSTDKPKVDVRIGQNSITLGEYVIKRYASRYYDPKTKAYKDVLGDKTIKAIALDGGFAFRYLAVDDVDAGLQALPIWLNPVKLTDPSGYKVIGQSKPLPIPAVKSICDGAVA